MTQAIDQIGPASRAKLSDEADEYFRRLWASLFYSGHVKSNNVMIASPTRKEGASTVACGLALAGSDKTVGARIALVDFNLHVPALHTILAARSAPGIAEVFSEGLDATEVVQSINDGLDFYSAGMTSGKVLAVLRNHGDKLADFLGVLNENYDHVLVDAASVCEFPSARVLVRNLKEVVLVVHAGKTRREIVSLAKEHLESAGGVICGVVLNQRTYPIPSFLYDRT